jgi:cytosine/adenosine deaminase-related metal-dependent hydrolase
MENVVISKATVVLADGIRRAPLHVREGRVATTAGLGGGDALELALPDHLIFPGLINAHDHLHLNSIPPLAHTAPFPNSYAWIAAFQPHLADPMVAAAAAVGSVQRHRHGALKNLLSGAINVQHHDPWDPAFDDPDFPVRVSRTYGWSHSLGLGMDAACGLPSYGPPVVQSFRATPSEEPWIIHLAEGTDEVAAAELARLDALGCLAVNTLIVHGVGLTESDTDLLVRRGAGVIWCPSSNLALLGRTLDPRRLFSAGRLALGSDSRLTGARDLLGELRVAAEHSDLTPRELLRLVTEDAARLLRMPLAGGLAAGQYADLLILHDQGGDPYQQLLAASRADLCVVVREGAPLVGDPGFAPWFDACDLEVARVTLDGRDKLISRRCVPRAQQRDVVGEPGLQLWPVS